MGKPRVCIVSPALPAANNGNSHTAARWQGFLADDADVDIVQAWGGEPVDALIALHALRSAPSIAAFRRANPKRALALVLTGTDLYRDLATEPAARQSVEDASALVVLQDEALTRLSPVHRGKARVIVQSATRVARRVDVMASCELLAVGHLRAVKDPLLLMEAARRLPHDSSAHIVHVGEALEPALAEAALRTMRECERYRWLGAVRHADAREHMARSRALVHMSRMEGGANVVIEAIRTGLPVLASRIDGNVGLLGRDYAGYFEAGDADGLAALMHRCAADAAFTMGLAEQCARQEPRFDPAHERANVRALLRDLL
jgi:putative glycosyltransferase (TIGR04348 family)